MNSGLRVLITGFVGLGLAASVAAQEAPPLGAPERFTGRIVDAGGAVPGAQATYFTLQVDSYSTPEEVKEYVAILEQGGMDAVVKKLWKAKSKGWIKVGDRLGYDVQIIRSIPTESGRVIRVVTDRPIQFFEVRQGTRSEDYPLGLIELRLGPDGKGEGTLIAAAQVKFTGTSLELETYGTQPFKILKVKTDKTKKK